MEPERQSLQIESIGTLAFWWSMIFFGKPASTLGSSPRAGFFHALFRPAEFARRELRERSRRPPCGGLHVLRHNGKVRRPPIQYRLLQLDERIDLPRRQAKLGEGGSKRRA